MLSKKIETQTDSRMIAKIIGIIILISIIYSHIDSAEARTITVKPINYIHEASNPTWDPSIIKAGNEYYIFYTRGSKNYLDAEYDPILNEHTLYYKKSSSLTQLNNSAETQIELSATRNPLNFIQNRVSAVYFKNKIFVFTSTGSEGQDRSLYYYSYDIDSDEWEGPVLMIRDDAFLGSPQPDENQSRVTENITGSGGEVNAAADDNYIYIVWSEADYGRITVWNTTNFLDNNTIINTQMYLDHRIDKPSICINDQKIFVSGYESAEGENIVIYSADKPSANTELMNFSIYTAPFHENDTENRYYQSIACNNTHMILTASRQSNMSMHIQTHTNIIGESSWIEENLTDAYYYDENNEIVSWNDILSTPYISTEGAYVFFASGSNDSKIQGNSRIGQLKIEGTPETLSANTINIALIKSSDYDTIILPTHTFYEQIEINNPISIIGNHTTIQYNQDDPAIIVNVDDIYISGTIVHQNTYGIYIIYMSNTSTITIRNNVITDNNNELSGIYTEAEDTIDLSYNYWGSPFGPDGIVDDDGNDITGSLKYPNWYTNENMDTIQYIEVLKAHNSLDFDLIRGENYNYSNVFTDIKQTWSLDNRSIHVSWEYNDSKISRDGKLIMPPGGTDSEEITLTAYISMSNSEVMEKNITIKLADSDEIIGQQMSEALSYINFDLIKSENTVEENISFNLNLTKRINNATILWNSSNNTVIDSEGNVYQGETEIPIRLIANISLFGESELTEFNLSVDACADEDCLYISRAKSYLEYEDILSSNPSKEMILSNMHLPAIMEEDISIYWTSEDQINNITENIRESCILDSASEFTCYIVPEIGLRIWQEVEEEDGEVIEYRGFSGDEIEFSCSRCMHTNFSDAEYSIDQDSEFCGFENNTLDRIVTDNITLCLRDSSARKTYELSLFSLAKGADECIDSDGNTCIVAENKTTLNITEYQSTYNIIRQETSSKAEITANITKNNSNSLKKFFIDIAPAGALAPYSRNEARVYKNSREIIINRSNSGNISTINLSKTDHSDPIIMNMNGMIEGEYENKIIVQSEINISRIHSGNNYLIRIPAGTQIMKESVWNGLIQLQYFNDPSDYYLDAQEISLSEGESLETDVVMEFESGLIFSSPVQIIFSGMGGDDKGAAYASEGTALFPITTACEGKDDATNINDGRCYYSEGGDLFVWTYDSGVFAAYTIEEDEAEIITNQNSGNSGSSRAYTEQPIVCITDWECGEWSECKENNNDIDNGDNNSVNEVGNEKSNSTRKCIDKNDCKTESGKPETSRECTNTHASGKKYKNEEENMMADEKNRELSTTKSGKNNVKNSEISSGRALFDLIVDIIKLDDAVLYTKIALINFGKVSTVDVNLSYNITDEKGIVVQKGERNISVNTQKEFIEQLDVSSLNKGQYILEMNLKYPGQTEPATAHKSFIINKGNNIITILIEATIGIVIIIIVLLNIFLKNKHHKIKEE